MFCRVHVANWNKSYITSGTMLPVQWSFSCRVNEAVPCCHWRELKKWSHLFFNVSHTTMYYWLILSKQAVTSDKQMHVMKLLKRLWLSDINKGARLLVFWRKVNSPTCYTVKCEISKWTIEQLLAVIIIVCLHNLCSVRISSQVVLISYVQWIYLFMFHFIFPMLWYFYTCCSVVCIVIPVSMSGLKSPDYSMNKWAWNIASTFASAFVFMRHLLPRYFTVFWVYFWIYLKIVCIYYHSFGCFGHCYLSGICRICTDLLWTYISL